MELEPLPDLFTDVYAPKDRRRRDKKIKTEKDSELNEIFNRIVSAARNFENKIKTQQIASKISIQQYKERQAILPEKLAPKNQKNQKYLKIEEKKKTRAGKQIRRKKEIAELQRIIPIATGSNKKSLIEKLKQLRKEQYWAKPETKIETTASKQEINNNIINNGHMQIFVIFVIVAFVLYKIDKYFKKYVHKHRTVISNV